MWQPIQIGRQLIANRIMVTAHNPLFGTAEYVEYLGARSRGGAGLIITGAIPVHWTSDAAPCGAGGARPVEPWMPDGPSGFAAIAETVHRHRRPFTRSSTTAGTSVMPSITSGNTNAPAIMIGERGADLILKTYSSG